MKIFELLKRILDDAYTAIAPTDPARDKAIGSAMVVLSNSFSDLKDAKRAAPDYAAPATRFAYVHKYTACHADIVADKVREVRDVARLFEGDGWVNVSCIGGGPGSDFLGIVKHMMRDGSQKSLKCFLLDKEAAWGDTWSGVEQHTDDLDFGVSTHCQALDVTDPSSWTVQTKYLKADLFTFIYFISEVWRLRASAEAFFKHLFKAASPGSLFLFVDNDESDFYGWFDTMAKDAGLELVDSARETFQIESGEEKRAIEPYFSKFTHQPKLRTKIAWRVYRKPAA